MKEQEAWVIAGVPVTVKRSARRRTVALQVGPGAVTLYAPKRIPLHDLQQVLHTRRAWVEQHLAQFDARPTSPLTFEDGSEVPFIGEVLTLEHVASLRRPGRQGMVLKVPAASPDEIKALVEGWTRRACLEPYRQIVQAYAGQLGAGHKLGRVGISSAAQRWGSCNSSGDIRLHWKLSRAPLDILHYVALHEAAHLHELNHSPRYWAHVERLMPDWKQHRQWLRDNGSSL